MPPGGTGAHAEELFRRYSRPVYGFCLSRLGDRHDAEDALQSTFLNAVRALERGVVPYAEAAWLFAIAQNVCLSGRRAAVRRRRLEAPGPLADDVPSAEHDAAVLVDLGGALRRLPPRQQRALLLREWQGLDYAEIADRLGLTHAAVETLLHRARRTLRAAA